MYAPYFVIQPYSTFITYFLYQFIIYILYIICLNANMAGRGGGEKKVTRVNFQLKPLPAHC